jgi:hypothetical protein
MNPLAGMSTDFKKGVAVTAGVIVVLLILSILLGGRRR